jgi:DMSO/TMAO reductase YedYZ heme-binding membrane subunit
MIIFVNISYLLQGIRRHHCYNKNMTTRKKAWHRQLLANSRFWILAVAVTVSVNVIGFVQLMVPSGSLQTIRIEQFFGFISLLLLYVAILASPLTKVFPNIPGKEAYLHARRAIGVSACYYALLHTYITFFQQLGGFGGTKYLNHTYHLSLLGGAFTLAVLCIMAATSFDWVVDHMGYKHWKLLHRLVYAASLAVLLHVLLIGPHYDKNLTLLGSLTYLAAACLIALELVRFRLAVGERSARHV